MSLPENDKNKPSLKENALFENLLARRQQAEKGELGLEEMERLLTEIAFTWPLLAEGQRIILAGGPQGAEKEIKDQTR